MSEVTNVYSSVVAGQSDPGVLLLLFFLLLQPVVPWHYYVRDSNNKATQRVVFICLLTTSCSCVVLFHSVSSTDYSVFIQILRFTNCAELHVTEIKGTQEDHGPGICMSLVGIGEILSHASFGVLNTVIHSVDILLGPSVCLDGIQYVLVLGVPVTIHHSVCDWDSPWHKPRVRC